MTSRSENRRNRLTRRRMLGVLVGLCALALMGGSTCVVVSDDDFDDDFDDDNFHGAPPLTEAPGFRLEAYSLDTAADGSRHFTDIEGISALSDTDPGGEIDGPALADFTTRLIEENEDLLGPVDEVAFDAADFGSDSILVTWRRVGGESVATLSAVAAPEIEFVFDLVGTLVEIRTAAPPLGR